MTPAELKMVKARTALILQQPFFGTLALRLKMFADETCATAWTDGRSLGYNPAFIDPLTMDQVKGLICHEVMHIANLHHTRRGPREPRRWNYAADYAINPLITGAGMSLPPGGLDNPLYHDQSAEHIYNALPPTPPGGDGGEDPAGEVRDLPGSDGTSATETEKALEEQQTKIDVVNAAQNAKAQGKFPAELARLVEELTETRVDWREALHRFVDQIARNDYSWRRPNRRYMSTGVILPGLYSEELPPIVVAVDTSGSVSADMLAQFGGELSGILEQYPTTIDVIYCDAQVQGTETFTRETLPVVLHARGGGGTDFRPVFKRIEDQEEPPTCLIYLTDMFGTFPKEAPDYPVLWITETKGHEGPFGETIRY